MADEQSQTGTANIEDRIDRVGRYSWFAKAGLSVIVAAFVVAVIGRLPYRLDSVPSAVSAVLMPTIFVGMGLLLYGIGMHLHVMHLNVVDQLRRRRSENDE